MTYKTALLAVNDDRWRNDDGAVGPAASATAAASGVDTDNHTDRQRRAGWQSVSQSDGTTSTTIRRATACPVIDRHVADCARRPQ